MKKNGTYVLCAFINIITVVGRQCKFTWRCWKSSRVLQDSKEPEYCFTGVWTDWSNYGDCNVGDSKLKHVSNLTICL